MYLFFDTETTGLPRDWNAPVTDLRNWPRMIQLAWLLTDVQGRSLSAGNYIIEPKGFRIPPQAALIHGITTERAQEEGVPLAQVLKAFEEALAGASYLIGHNVEFDYNIVGAEWLRMEQRNAFFDLPRICTMKSSTEYCALPGKYGYKYPSLSELYRKLFATGFDGAHSAQADVAACAACFFELSKRGVIGPLAAPSLG